MKINLGAGLAVGLLDFLLLCTLHWTGVLKTDLGVRLLMLTLFTHALGLIVAMVVLRRQEGGAGFARLFGAGLLVSLVAGVTAAGGMYVFLQRIDPTYLDYMLEDQRRHVIETWPEDQRDAALAQLDATTPAVYAGRGTIGGYMIRGFFLTLMLAAILRLRILGAEKDGAEKDGAENDGAENDGAEKDGAEKDGAAGSGSQA